MMPDFIALGRIPRRNRRRRLIQEKIFSAGGTPGVQSRQAPVVAMTAEAGAEQDLETRIDEAPLVEDRDALAFGALRERLGGDGRSMECCK